MSLSACGDHPRLMLNHQKSMSYPTATIQGLCQSAAGCWLGLLLSTEAWKLLRTDEKLCIYHVNKQRERESLYIHTHINRYLSFS